VNRTWATELGELIRQRYWQWRLLAWCQAGLTNCDTFASHQASVWWKLIELAILHDIAVIKIAKK
jgi:hypothetical protein